MAMTVVQNWLTLLISLVTLISVVFGIVKVINRNEQEWKDREQRLRNLENDQMTSKAMNLEVVQMKTQLNELREMSRAQLTEIRDEMGRVRNRLDAFLDRPFVDKGAIRREG